MGARIADKPIENVRSLGNILVGDLYLVLYRNAAYGNSKQYGLLMSPTLDTFGVIQEASGFFPIETRDKAVARTIYERINSPDDFKRESENVLAVLKSE